MKEKKIHMRYAPTQHVRFDVSEQQLEFFFLADFSHLKHLNHIEYCSISDAHASLENRII